MKNSKTSATIALTACVLLFGSDAAADAACPNAPHSGTWNFEAGHMSVDGQFTPMGGGKVPAEVVVHDCGARIDANIPTVGDLSFKHIDGIKYSADKLPPAFSKGIHWDLQAFSPTQMSSIVYFREPSEHSQAHMWLFAGGAVGASIPEEAAVAGAGLSPPAKLKGKQGLWGYVTPGEEIGWFNSDQGGQEDVSPTVCTPPDQDGFYHLPFEAGESGWFCMVKPPCRDAKLASSCVHWSAVEGLKYCGFNGTNWDC